MSIVKKNNNVLQLLFLKVEQAEMKKVKEILNAHPYLVN
jgi:dUTPase